MENIEEKSMDVLNEVREEFIRYMGNNMEYFNLSNGERLPVIGLGPGDVMPQGYPYTIYSKNIILKLYQKIINKVYYLNKSHMFIDNNARALKIGYKLIDNSAAYGTAHLLLKAIKKAGLKREDVYITTRASNHAQRNHCVREEFMQTLKSFETDYVDLMQFHWPVTDCYVDTWREIIKLKEEGYIKTIGVANCNIHHLETLFKETGVMPTVNQFEVHPLFTQKELIAYCRNHGIQVEAYTPIARNDHRMHRLPVMKKIAEKYNKSIIQIVIRWHIQQGRIPVVGARSQKNQLSDLDVFDFTLTDDELTTIDGININSRLRYDPDNCDFSIL